MLNEKKIEKLCKENRFGYNYFGDNAIITTDMDTWMLEGLEVYDRGTGDYKRIIKLRHRNKIGNKTEKAHFHTQRFVSNINYAFDTIREHEQSSRVYQKAFRIKDTLKEYSI